jgi:DNA-binding NtrC family response regulator
VRAATRILIVDDEEAVRDSLSQVLAKEGYEPQSAANGRDAMALFARDACELVFLDLRLPDEDGLAVLRRMKEMSPETPIIMITGFASIESAVETVKLGAFDYLAKPFTPEELRVVTRRALANRAMLLENLLLHRELRAIRQYDRIVGRSKALQNIIDLVARVGPTDSSVLITGESGTGKELTAREIHRLSPRQASPFVTVACDALSDPLLEDELFGHAEGARSRARETKHGRLELAHGGTLFLDDVSRLSLPLQSKLFRALQEKEVTRLGNPHPLHVDVRVIAAASVNLAQAVNQGVFREDLFYRLSVVPLHLPPLRDRKEDIPLLVEHFLQKYGRKAGKNVSAASPRTMLALTEYDWPGNIRELENTIERAVVLSRGEAIDLEDVMSHGISMGIPALTWAGDKFKTLADIEKAYIKTVLRDQEGNKSRTAAILGIERKTLWSKIKKYRLEEKENT